MPGYVRQDTTNNIETGNIIDAQDLDNEFNALQTAFSLGSGHRHNGAAGEGAPITVIGPNQEVEANASALRPNTTNVVDLGTTSLRFKAGFFQGTVTAGAFAGSGAALTALNASQLTSGNVDAARVVGSYPNITGVGVLTVGSIGSGFGNINIGAGIFTGNGSGLTNLDATQLLSGTVPSGRITGSYTSITGVGALTIGSIASGFGNINIGTNTFTGNGSGLTNLNASNITSGILPIARLPQDSSSITWVGNAINGAMNDGIVGQLSFLRNDSGSTINTGGLAFSSDLRHSSTALNASSTPAAGTWRALAAVPAGAAGLFVRVA